MTRTARRPHRGYQRPVGKLLDPYRGRLPRLYEQARFDPACAGCVAKPSDQIPHSQHRAVASVIPVLIGQAMPMRVAAGRAGVPERLVWSWLQRGAREIEAMVDDDRDEPIERERPYVEFTEAVLFAQADAQHRLLGEWRLAGRKDWRALQAYAAEVWPAQFGKSAVVQVEMSGVPSLDEIEAALSAAVARLQHREPGALPPAEIEL